MDGGALRAEEGPCQSRGASPGRRLRLGAAEERRQGLIGIAAGPLLAFACGKPGLINE
jgi:hypothetical protein